MDYEIRTIREEDLDAITALRKMPSVIAYTLTMPSEREDKMYNFFESMDEYQHMYVAVSKEQDKKVLGFVMLNVQGSLRRRHVGSIAIMIDTNYHNMGIGTRLMETIIDIADNWLMLKRVELEVSTTNEVAIHLYEKFGFEIEGTRKQSSITNGKYTDDYIMARIK